MSSDIFSGYAVYAPITVIIKGVMAIIANFSFRLMSSKLGNIPSRIISGTLAEIEMVLGYFVFEGFMYGFTPSVVNIPANAVQGIAGIVVGVMLVKIFEKSKVF